MPLNLDVALGEINTGSAADGAPIVADGSGGAKIGSGGGGGSGLEARVVPDIDVQGVSNVAVTWGSAVYREILANISHCHPENGGAPLYFQVTSDNGASWRSSNGNYFYDFENCQFGSAASKVSSTAGSEVPLSGAQSTASGQFIAGTLRFIDPSNGINQDVEWNGRWSDGNQHRRYGRIYMPSTSGFIINGFKIWFPGDTINAVRVHVRGVV